MNEQLHSPETDLNALLETLMAPRPTVIGIEGGPCSGKTTLINRLSAEAVHSGRQLVVLPEAATQHIIKLQANGIDPAELAANDREGWLAFEADVMRTISEQIIEAQAQFAGTDAIIVADRCDIGAYLTADEHRQVVELLGYDEAPLISLVDQLYFLPTVAREDTARYEMLRLSNQARYESAEQAIATDQANLESVSNHPELHIAWGGEFEQKIQNLVSTIFAAETEGEIKFGVNARQAEKVLRAAVERGDALNMSLITQSYHEHNGQEFRLRATTGKDTTKHYYFTIKTGEGAFRQELQRKISEADYCRLAECQQLGHDLHKVRYSFLDHDGQTGKRLWQADVYQLLNLDEWHFETDVHDQAEHDRLLETYAGQRRLIAESAKSLIFKPR